MTVPESTPAARCPFGGDALTRRPDHPDRPGEAPQADARGVVQVRSFQGARDVLRSEAVTQAGFNAETVNDAGILKRRPVLFTEGEEHHEMRRDTARYFTPAAVATYQPMIAALADRLIGRLAARGEANIDDLSLTLAVQVASQVVGLTSSRVPGLERRVMTFVEHDGNSEPGMNPEKGRLRSILDQRHLLAFYLLDVKPAIQARRTQRRDDLISHLLDRKYSDLEILTECLTYGTAGMVTTREFITVATWHLLRQPELRAAYVHGTEKERLDILHEILRLEPVVSTLYRRAQADLTVDGQTIPQGTLLALNLADANTDPAVAGEQAASVCPARPLPRGVQAPVMAFGDGHHRCPGAFLAIKETDTFLRRLLIWQDLRLVAEPRVTFNEVVKGYELRGLRVALGRS
ncbi:cytochrome P450 [Deinococcus radiotolerans]|uniref:Cytochrome P450, putative n=1 Tax=Deinococcus radiotolerans TaxID=1309407 RepID=A0ABQ2FLI8_9DEIO|nr:cytochrome P450 [Deinococcus radiotolerans]GGL04284.1 cytochrome P450, putative [Deinococcus radiotolerans]